MNQDYTAGGLSSEHEDPEGLFVEGGTESFTEFDLWMDNQLEGLVARWIHAAAPNANRPEFSGRMHQKH